MSTTPGVGVAHDAVQCNFTKSRLQRLLLSSLSCKQEALQFFSRLALLCERNCLALQDFTGELGDVAALDLGCAVGGGSYELAKAFPRVVGVDSSAHFIKAAQVVTPASTTHCKQHAILHTKDCC